MMNKLPAIFLSIFLCANSNIALSFDRDAEFALFVFNQFCINLYPLQTGALEIFLADLKHRELPQEEAKEFLIYGKGKVYIVSEAKEFLLIVEENHRCSIYMNGLNKENVFAAWATTNFTLREKELISKRLEKNDENISSKSYTYIDTLEKIALKVNIYAGKEINKLTNFRFDAAFFEVIPN